jgi:hypothetical protein
LSRFPELPMSTSSVLALNTPVIALPELEIFTDSASASKSPICRLPELVMVMENRSAFRSGAWVSSSCCLHCCHCRPCCARAPHRRRLLPARWRAYERGSCYPQCGSSGRAWRCRSRSALLPSCVGQRKPSRSVG